MYLAYFGAIYDNSYYLEHKESIEHIINKINEGKAKIVSSILVKAEILSVHYKTREKKAFIEKFLNRPEIQFDPVNNIIAQETEKIRSHLISKHSKSLPCVDAVHLATAILRGAKYLHTGDRDHLMDCNGKIDWSDILITHPFIEEDLSDIDIYQGNIDDHSQMTLFSSSGPTEHKDQISFINGKAFYEEIYAMLGAHPPINSYRIFYFEHEKPKKRVSKTKQKNR